MQATPILTQFCILLGYRPRTICTLNLKSLPIPVPEIQRSPNYKSRSRDIGHAPFDLLLHFFGLHAQRSISTPNLKPLALSFTEIWRGSQNYKSRSRDVGHAPFDLILHIFGLQAWRLIRIPNFKSLASSVPDIWRGFQNYKSRSRDVGNVPFDLVLHFWGYGPGVQSEHQI